MIVLSWSVPVIHLGISICRVVQTCRKYAISAEGVRMFGLMQLETTFNGCRFAIGMWNSHNKSMRPSRMQSSRRHS